MDAVWAGLTRLASNRKCLAFSLDESQSLLSRYLDAVTQWWHEDDINEHFRTQSRQCLASAALKQAASTAS